MKMNAPERGRLRKAVYADIKLLIVTGQIPPGARLVEADLAIQLNVSRTPVREALNSLERDGLVVIRPRSGFAVAAFDAAAARDAFDLREALEVHSARLAAERIDDAGRARLRSIISECAVIAALPERTMQESLIEMQLGIDLHRVIAQLSGNRMLADALDRVLDRCQAWVWMDLTRLGTWDAARADHGRIVAAICDGNGPLAAEEIRTHIHDAQRNVLRLLHAKRGLSEHVSSGLVMSATIS